MAMLRLVTGRLHIGAADVSRDDAYTLFFRCWGISRPHAQVGQKEKDLGEGNDAMRNHSGPRSRTPNAGRYESGITKPTRAPASPFHKPNGVGRFNDRCSPKRETPRYPQEIVRRAATHRLTRPASESSGNFCTRRIRRCTYADCAHCRLPIRRMTIDGAVVGPHIHRVDPADPFFFSLRDALVGADIDR